MTSNILSMHLDDIKEALEYAKKAADDGTFVYTDFYGIVVLKETERLLKDDSTFVEMLLDETNSPDTAYILELTDNVYDKINDVCNQIVKNGLSQDIVDTQEYDGDIWLKTITGNDIPRIILMQNEDPNKLGVYIPKHDILALTILDKKGAVTNYDQWKLSTPAMYATLSHELKHKIDVLRSQGKGYRLHTSLNKFKDPYMNYSNTEPEVKAFAQEIVALMKNRLDSQLDSEITKGLLFKDINNSNVKNADILKNVIRNLFHSILTYNPFVKVRFDSLSRQNKNTLIKEIYAYFTNEFLRNYKKYKDVINSTYIGDDITRYNAWKAKKKLW